MSLSVPDCLILADNAGDVLEEGEDEDKVLREHEPRDNDDNKC